MDSKVKLCLVSSVLLCQSGFLTVQQVHASSPPKITSTGLKTKVNSRTSVISIRLDYENPSATTNAEQQKQFEMSLSSMTGDNKDDGLQFSAMHITTTPSEKTK